jgi:predicted Rossmann fold nucleotide-binding protein DprA/Smf involved in DNA uptake
LRRLILLSNNAYAKYISNRIFLHAQSIKAANIEICELLTKQSAYLPESLITDAIELINHYRIWMTQFDDQVTKQKPGLSDIFVFHRIDNQPGFPKTAEQHFFEYYKNMRSELFTINLSENKI